MTQTQLNMQYTRQQLIDALAAEYDYLCHDDFDPDVDMSPDEHLEYLIHYYPLISILRLVSSGVDL